MKDIKEYKTTGEWFKDARECGYSFPLAMCNGLDLAQKELKLSFSEVFELFVGNNIVIKYINFYIYNMEGHKGINRI